MSRTPIELFVEALPAALGQALSGKAAQPWAFTVDDKPKAFAAGTQLVTMLLVAEPSQAEAAIEIGMETALSLAPTTGETTTAEGLQPGPAQAVRALLAEACDQATKVLQGTQIHLRVAKELTWTPAKQFSLTGTSGSSKSIQVQVLFTADWPQAATTTEGVPVQTPQASKGVDVSLLENVEIDVTLQFGERRLPLREIGELRSGSVVELDKYVQDPAELLLGDRVVARGEVVIVDGTTDCGSPK